MLTAMHGTLPVWDSVTFVETTECEWMWDTPCDVYVGGSVGQEGQSSERRVQSPPASLQSTYKTRVCKGKPRGRGALETEAQGGHMPSGLRDGHRSLSASMGGREKRTEIAKGQQIQTPRVQYNLA